MELAKYHTSIHTCPMIAFSEAMATGDYRHLKSWGIHTRSGGFNAFCSLFDAIDKKYGIADDFRAYIKKRIKASEYLVKAINGQKHYKTRALILQEEAESLLVGGSSVAFESTCASLTKKMGIYVNPLTITVADYYAYLSN